MSRFEQHIFVCENHRPPDNPKGSCKAAGAEEVRLHLKTLVEQAGLKGRVRCNSAGCLDACALGPAVVIYPEGTWYTLRTREDAEEVFREHIQGGRVVQRLLMNLPAVRKANPPPA
jgi:(2Fe-2S) ferredoxin